MIKSITKYITIVLTVLSLTACSDEVYGPVSQSVPENVFEWDNIEIEIGQDNGWALTRYNNRIALTHADNQVQYLLSWTGDSGEGEKSNAVIYKTQVGYDLQMTPLDHLTVYNINGTHYHLSFSSGQLTGTITIPMQ